MPLNILKSLMCVMPPAVVLLSLVDIKSPSIVQLQLQPNPHIHCCFWSSWFNEHVRRYGRPVSRPQNESSTEPGDSLPGMNYY